MDLTIRRLGPGDEHVLTLTAVQAADFDLEARGGPDEPLDEVTAADYLSDPAVLHWVAEQDGEVIGELLCHVLRLPSGRGVELLLYSIGVRSAHRRGGVGRALVDQMLTWAGDNDVPLVWVLADNPGAEAFYGACGFLRGADNDQGVLLELDVDAIDRGGRDAQTDRE